MGMKVDQGILDRWGYQGPMAPKGTEVPAANEDYQEPMEPGD